MNRDHTPQPDIQTGDAVRFIHLRVTVNPAVDYGCRGPWMYAAVDSVGFRRRTEQTELILAPVLSANIYVTVTGPLVNIVVNGFLANAKYAVARPSVCCLSSVTLVHPTQAVQIFRNISTAFGTLAIR